MIKICETEKVMYGFSRCDGRHIAMKKFLSCTRFNQIMAVQAHLPFEGFSIQLSHHIQQPCSPQIQQLIMEGGDISGFI